jgi:hypothetical protein
MNPVKRTLTEARKLLQEGWTQNHFAENEDGERRHYDDEDACKFCLGGAIIRSSRNSYEKVATLETMVTHLGMTVFAFNDTPGMSQRLVIEAVDEVIAKFDESSL